MSKTLTEIAQQLKAANKKVQLIYAFNGSGKTRLSRAFKAFIAPKTEEGEETDQFDQLKTVALLLNHLVANYGYWQEEEQND